MLRPHRRYFVFPVAAVERGAAVDCYFVTVRLAPLESRPDERLVGTEDSLQREVGWEKIVAIAGAQMEGADNLGIAAARPETTVAVLMIENCSLAVVVSPENGPVGLADSVRGMVVVFEETLSESVPVAVRLVGKLAVAQEE